MLKIKKGDIVGRISYGKDIFFIVEDIINLNKKEIAILKGLTIRIKADSPVEDLEILSKELIQNYEENLEKRFQERIQRCTQIYGNNKENREKEIIYTGRILHLDGDKKYSIKANNYYKKIGLKAIVKNVPENRQPIVVVELIARYKPDILVITGHDGMIKKGTKYNDLRNYRNSAYFIECVGQARAYKALQKDLVIFAGACQSYYEGLILAGANFASSPARILIDFIDPLIVAEKIAITDEKNFLTIKDIEDELRDGKKGINGIGARGKKKTLTT